MEFIKHKTILVFFLIIWFTSNTPVNGNDRITEAFKNSYASESEGNFIAAINHLKGVYAEDNYELNLRLGWLSYLGGIHHEAVKYYARAIKIMPFSIEPKLGIVLPESVLGNWDAVVKHYKDILTIAPAHSQTLYNLGLIYYNQYKFNEAEQQFKKLVNLYPFDYDGLLMLGWTNYRQGKAREAKILFQKALLHTPESESAAEGLRLLSQ